MEKVVNLDGYTPLNGRILVVQDPAKAFTKAGIEIPEDKRVKPNTGRVEKLADKIEQPIEPGDMTLFRPGGGMPLTIKGKEFLLLHESEFFLKYGKDDEAPNK